MEPIRDAPNSRAKPLLHRKRDECEAEENHTLAAQLNAREENGDKAAEELRGKCEDFVDCRSLLTIPTLLLDRREKRDNVFFGTLENVEIHR
jgi:hypothetical protein